MGMDCVSAPIFKSVEIRVDVISFMSKIGKKLVELCF